MRIVSLGLLLLFIVGCVTSRSPSAESGEHVSNLTLDQAMDIVGQLHIGMPEHEVVALLETNGLHQTLGRLGDSFGWSLFFNLSENHQLCVDFTTTLRGPDHEHANGDSGGVITP